jgi:hypothetical protein
MSYAVRLISELLRGRRQIQTESCVKNYHFTASIYVANEQYQCFLELSELSVLSRAGVYYVLRMGVLME